jgi:hypothetical protein
MLLHGVPHATYIHALKSLYTHTYTHIHSHKNAYTNIDVALRKPISNIQGYWKGFRNQWCWRCVNSHNRKFHLPTTTILSHNTCMWKSKYWYLFCSLGHLKICRQFLGTDCIHSVVYWLRFYIETEKVAESPTVMETVHTGIHKWQMRVYVFRCFLRFARRMPNRSRLPLQTHHLFNVHGYFTSSNLSIGVHNLCS